MTKWSKGPYRVVDRSEYRVSASDPQWEIDQVSGREPFWLALAINRENADLFAASWDMYEALEALPLDAFDKDMDTIDAAEFVDNAAAFFGAMQKARAAMAMARGEV